MEQGTLRFADASAPAPAKLCECGCGQPAPIARSTRRKHGQIKGQPGRFIPGHVGGPPLVLFVAVGQRIGHGVVIEAELGSPDAARKGAASGQRVFSVTAGTSTSGP